MSSIVLLSDAVVVKPESLPVEVAEFKLHSRIDYSHDDNLIESYLNAAAQHIEGIAGRALITQTREARYRRFAPIMTVPSPMVQSITSVIYLDANRDLQTVPSADYHVDMLDQPWGQAEIIPAQAWPLLMSEASDAVRIRYVCGFGDYPEDVPETLRQACRLLAAHWYENREAVGAQMSKMPFTVDALIEPWRYRRPLG